MTPDLSAGQFALAFLSGIASVLSPCVLPVLPIVAAGSERDHRLRPILISIGLAISFMIMGVLTSLAGARLAGQMRTIEIISGLLVAIMGALLLLGIDAFKRLSFLQQFSPKIGVGPFSGLLVGMALGLVWIPCIGPFLSSVLTLVATQGNLVHGILLLAMYSLGLSIPVMIAGFASRWFRSQTQGLRKYALMVRLLSAFLLIAFGVFIATRGSYGLQGILS